MSYAVFTFPLQGVEWISDYPVSFHYVTPDEMYDMEYFVYHLSAYGIVNGIQDLNGHPVQPKLTSASISFTTRRPQGQQQQQQQQQQQK